MMENYEHKYKPIQNSAFSLIELMVVIDIVGILAAVAMPSYRAYVQKARYTEIVTMIGVDAKKLSLYFSLNGMPTDQTSADAMIAQSPLTVCNSEDVNTTTTTGSGATCGFTHWGIRVLTDTSQLPDARFHFTPTDNNGIYVWKCTYGSASSEEGIEMMPQSCDAVTNGQNATRLW